MVCDQNRVNEVASLFSELGIEGIEAFDEEEPEYDTLVTLANRYESDSHLSLLSVMAGLTDYQLAINAQAYWDSLEKTVHDHGSLNSIQDVNTIMNEFLDEPVNARFTDKKRERLVRLNKNEYPKWFLGNYPIKSPDELWEQTAIDLGGRRKMNSKTVVLAMKILDIHNLIVNDTYLDFPDNIDIPVDVHVKRVALFSGITSSTNAKQVRQCWAEVADQIEAELGANISLLRIDSVVFQLGQLISQAGFEPDDSRQKIIQHALISGVSANEAEQLALTLTTNLDGDPIVRDS